MAKKVMSCQSVSRSVSHSQSVSPSVCLTDVRLSVRQTDRLPVIQAGSQSFGKSFSQPVRPTDSQSDSQLGPLDTFSVPNLIAIRFDCSSAQTHPDLDVALESY